MILRYAIILFYNKKNETLENPKKILYWQFFLEVHIKTDEFTICSILYMCNYNSNRWIMIILCNILSQDYFWTATCRFSLKMKIFFEFCNFLEKSAGAWNLNMRVSRERKFKTELHIDSLVCFPSSRRKPGWQFTDSSTLPRPGPERSKNRAVGFVLWW